MLTYHQRYGAPYSTGPASDLGNQSNHGRKGKNPSEPSMDVIFLGLDPELTEDDVSISSVHFKDISD